MAFTQKIALKAVISKMLNTTAITNLVSTRVYSKAPQNVTFPYIITEISSAPFADKDSSHQEHSIIIHAFSRKDTPKEAMDIIEAVYNAIDRNISLTLDSGSLVRCHFDGLNDVFLEADGITSHGVINFKMLIA